MKQLPFALYTEANLTKESYFITDSNKDAFNWVQKWPNWGEGLYSNIFYLYGDENSGKTHLSKIWQNISKAVELKKEDIISQKYFSLENENFILENVELCQDNQNELFYFLNFIINSSKNLLITSCHSTNTLNFNLQDLTSRIRSFFSIKINQPDDQMVKQILSKYFADKQIIIEANVVEHLSNKVNRSYSEIAVLVEAIDKSSLSLNKKITIPLIKKLLLF